MIGNSTKREKADKRLQPRIERVPDGPPIDFSNKNIENMEDLEKLKVKAFEANLTKIGKGGPEGLAGHRGAQDMKEGLIQGDGLKKGDRKDEGDGHKHEKSPDHIRHYHGAGKDNVSLVPKNHLEQIITNNDIALTNTNVK